MTLSDEVRQFLDDVHFAVVATLRKDGTPHQTVMWYLLDGDHLLLSTPASSAKVAHLRRTPFISVCVEDTYRYVTVAGTATLSDDPDETQADMRRLMQRYMDAGQLAQTGARRPREEMGDHFSNRISIRVAIERVHGNEVPA